MNHKTIEDVLNLKPVDRYGYLIQNVADSKQIFLIADQNGSYVTCGTDENECIPVWPELAFAQEFLRSDWKNHKVVLVQFNSFLEWMDKLEIEGYNIGGFPDKEFYATVVKPNEIKNHLIFESNKQEKTRDNNI